MSETILDPKDVAGHATLAHDLTQAGPSPESLAAVQAALRLSPDDSDLHGLLGFHSIALTGADGSRADAQVAAQAAAAAFQRAVELDSANTYALSYLGMLQGWLGNKAEAVKLLKASIAAGATDFRTFNTLRYYQVRMRDFRGMARTMKAIAAMPDSEERDEWYREASLRVRIVEISLSVAGGLAAFLIWRKWRGSSRG